MKKIFLVLAILCISVLQANAAVTTFDNAYSQNGNKPMMVLVYANWADGYQNALAQFRNVQQTFGKSYNFVELDLASKDAKSYCDKFMITPGMPYIMLFRSNCKISRLIDKSCAANSACISSKAKAFIE